MQLPMCVSSVAGLTSMTSVDTNIIFSVIDPEDANHANAKPLLETVGQRELLVIAPVVYAELMASRIREVIRQFLKDAAIEVLWDIPPGVWDRAGVTFGTYARERRQGRLPRRLVADFVIAAHAEHHNWLY